MQTEEKWINSGITSICSGDICSKTNVSNNTRNTEWWTDEIRREVKNIKDKWKKKKLKWQYRRKKTNNEGNLGTN